jgi:hypothetical protein
MPAVCSIIAAAPRAKCAPIILRTAINIVEQNVHSLGTLSEPGVNGLSVPLPRHPHVPPPEKGEAQHG